MMLTYVVYVYNASRTDDATVPYLAQRVLIRFNSRRILPVVSKWLAGKGLQQNFGYEGAC